MKIDPEQFDRIARTVFAPVYPMIAEQIIDRTGVTSGVCIDIGCGGGYLGAALGRLSQLFVYFFDPSPQMLAIAGRTIEETGLQSRAGTLEGVVEKIALPDASVDLAVSRGSIFFWKDLPLAFAEIHRILAPGGWAVIGGGFGSLAVQQQIEARMREKNQGGEQFSDKVKDNLSEKNRKRFEASLVTAGIDSFSIDFTDDRGLWAVIRK